MTPNELAAKGTESGEQKALFAWAAMACYRGFLAADDDASYMVKGHAAQYGDWRKVPELKWLHAIPNGGKRDAITAARMKAEGSRAGVYDIFLPVARQGCHGLYIELKPLKAGRESDEQKEFGAFVMQQGFHAEVKRGWRTAADLIQKYLT